MYIICFDMDIYFSSLWNISTVRTLNAIIIIGVMEYKIERFLLFILSFVPDKHSVFQIKFNLLTYELSKHLGRVLERV